MGGTLLWRAKDVGKVCLVLVLWITAISLPAQSIGARRVNCAFNATRLDEVIHHLSLEAGVSFIYSSNKTDLNKVVSLNVENRSLEETLAIIGTQLGIEFKMVGRYVMIKQHTDGRAPQPSALGKVPLGHSRKLPSVTDGASYYPMASTRLLMPSFVERDLPSFEPTQTTAQVSSIPLAAAREISAYNRHAGWFMSVGPVLNDYSSGFEIQAGMRRAYFVFTPTWMASTRFHGGYGFGTSIDLGRNLSFNPVYSLGSSQHSSTTKWRNTQGLNELKQKEKMIHHQLKLMLQYAVAPSFVVRMGPTINQSYTTYDTYQTTTFYQKRSVIGTGLGDGPGAGVVITQVDGYKQPTLLSEQRVRNAWLGWEASIAFKINFLQKK
jgi:hypothetical protein